jgi:hypothetical protein
VTQLRAAYGTPLRSVVLYGSAVAGEHIAKRSDYNVLVITDEIPMNRLREISSAMRAWRDAGNPPPRTFTMTEWHSAADVFPMEYADVIERHRVLYGEDPFPGVVVDPADLRLQVEREALAVLLRLRQGVLLAGADAGEQIKLMAASLSALMIVLRGVLRLHGQSTPQDYGDLARAVARITGIDAAPIDDVVHEVRGDRRIPKDRAAGVLAGYLKATEAIARHVDALPPTNP